MVVFSELKTAVLYGTCESTDISDFPTHDDMPWLGGGSTLIATDTGAFYRYNSVSDFWYMDTPEPEQELV